MNEGVSNKPNEEVSEEISEDIPIIEEQYSLPFTITDIIDAKVLDKDYEENMYSGDQKYKDKTFIVNGHVYAITRNFIQFEGYSSDDTFNFDISGAVCFFDANNDEQINNVAQLREGGKIQILGIVSGKGTIVGVDIDPCYISPDMNNYLFQAVLARDVEAMKMSIKAGANINAIGTNPNIPIYDKTLLHWAAQNGYADVVHILIENGADVYAKNRVYAKDRNGNTPLHWAAQNGYTDVVQVLIGNGADVFAKDRNGNTPLHWAISNGHTDLVDILRETEKMQVEAVLYRGADWSYIDVEKVNRWIETGGDVNAKVGLGDVPLVQQAIKKNVQIAQLLLDNGADANAKDNNGNTLLHITVGVRIPTSTPLTLAQAQLLLDNGADVNTKDNNGNTPLHKVISRTDLSFRGAIAELIQLLLDNGADVNTKDNNGNTPLNMVISRTDLSGRTTELIQLLLDNGADVNTKDNNGNTPLNMVISRTDLSGRTTELIQLLLDNGADVNTKDNNGNTPLNMVISRTDLSGRTTELIQLLLDNGADVNTKDNNDNTPLHIAVGDQIPAETTLTLARLLLDNGADTNARDNNDNTPLHRMISPMDPLMDRRERTNTREAATELMQLLLDNGANVNAKDNEGNTPLHRVVVLTQQDISGLFTSGFVQLLLDNGADVNARDNDGNTPLSGLHYHFDSYMIQLLRRHGATE